ncbi:DUF6351 family protein [Acinetobacter sp. GN11]
MSNTNITFHRSEHRGRTRIRRDNARRQSIGIGLTLAATAVVLASCGGDSSSVPIQPSDTAQAACNKLLNQEFEGAKVTQVTLVPQTGSVPETCVVRGEMPKELAFEVKMPTTWNNRVLFMGGGGFDGTINKIAYSPSAAENGYATIASNHGHDAVKHPQGSFALDPQLLQDYADGAVPKVLASAKAILRARYGDSIGRSKFVYEGCSGGGRQALILAQRHPDLFDGIIARAPANAYTGQFLWYQKILKQLAKPGASLSVPKVTTIANFMQAQCDALDGLKDHTISRPEACNPDLTALRCTGAESDACLTEAQLESAKTLYEPTSVAGGRYTWPSFPQVGGETADDASWQAIGGTAYQILGGDFMRYFVAQDPSVNPLQVDPLQYTSRLDYLANLIDAVNPDLSQFRARNGKLLLMHGTTDWLITMNNTTDYYNKVVAAAGGQTAADQFVEYYVLPGNDHCAATPNGGNGPDMVDLVTPMFDWIDGGAKPSSHKIIATRSVDPAKGMQRPLCRYPQYPKYNGTGDPNAESSFTCVSSQ